ncbi:MAG: multidrug efflux SMR transporter [Xanthomonadales bacterium]|nr:multidrug efflux SMR transporter [Xanthomonadales bacterium]
MRAWLLLAAAILAEVVATSALKAADGFRHPLPTALSLGGYLVAFWCLSLALRSIPVGVAYAVWSGVGIALISLVGWWLYGQRLDTAALAGIALIVAGVAVLGLGSRSFAA